MDTYIPNIISSLKTNTRMSVSSVLKNIKVDKTQINSLIANVADFQTGNKYIPSLTPKFSVLNKELVIDNFRDADLRIRQYYSIANRIGLIINSMIDVFFSEIEKVEKDIEILNNFISNYEYISGKDDLYNSNYIEKFDNFLSDYRSDGLKMQITDKDGSIFSENGNGFVDQKSGVFKIGESTVVNNSLNNIEFFNVKTNYEFIDHSDSGFEGCLTETRQDSWSVSIKAPTIISSNLSEVVQYCGYDVSAIKGAQACVEIYFSNPDLIDTIYITPNYSKGLQLLQAVIFEEDQVVGIDPVIENPITISTIERTSQNSLIKLALNSPVLIDTIKEISFEKTLCKKIILIFNQPIYQRTENTAQISEITSRSFYAVAKNIRSQRKSNTDKLQDLIYSMFYQNQTLRNIKKNTKIINNYYSYRYPCIDTVGNNSYENNVTSNDLIEAGLYDKSEGSIISKIFSNFFSQAFDAENEIFEQNIYMENYRSGQQSYNFNSPGYIAMNSSNNYGNTKYQEISPLAMSSKRQSVLIDLLNEEKRDQYEYSFSLKSIEFANTEKIKTDKACFISKKIPFNGHVLGVKAKVNKTPSNISLSNYTYDLKEPTSFELYFSNKEVPVNQSDWISIMPSEQSSVESEVLFFDNQNFIAYTRFSFIQDTVSIYKDGYILPPDAYTLYDLNRIEINQFDPSSIYVCKYSVDNKSYQYDTIDFVKYGLIVETTRQASDSDGIGEAFNKTDLTNKITLSEIPYVNSESILGSVYSPSIGTVFSGNYSSYNPVKIIFQDGTTAINLTNYSTTNNSAVFPDLNNYYFIQNGKNIIFNKYVSIPFRVIYEYLPNVVRFKLIIRKNIPGIDYNCSVDSVLVKAKTKIYDPNYDKLTKVSITN